VRHEYISTLAAFTPIQGCSWTEIHAKTQGWGSVMGDANGCGGQWGTMKIVPPLMGPGGTGRYNENDLPDD